MANWCYTYIYVTADKESLDRLEKEFAAARLEGKDKGPNEDTPLEYLLRHIGYPEEKIKANTPKCDGFMYCLSRQDDKLIVYTYTRWVPMVQCIRLFCNKYVNADIQYVAEERAMGLLMADLGEKADYFFYDWDGKAKLPQDIRDLLERCNVQTVDKACAELAGYLGHEGELKELFSELRGILKSACGEDYLSYDIYKYVSLDDIT